MRASSMFSSLTDTSAFSDNGEVAPAGDHVRPLSVDTSTTTGHIGAPVDRRAQVPTTAHTSGPMALTSDTTGPIPARFQVRPPSEVTHKATVPADEGGPPHR